MIGDEIDERKLNFLATKKILAVIQPLLKSKKFVFAIAGESGSGKTYMSIALKKELENQGVRSLILHMDDFFHLPPATNHQNRLADLGNIGPHELDLPRLNQVIKEFIHGEQSVSLPQIHYYLNMISEIEVSLQHIDTLIIEGTYAFFLENTDFHLYMSRNYLETREFREQRNRGNEVNDPFVEIVLQIEHKIISATKNKADAWIDFDHNLKYHAQD